MIIDDDLYGVHGIEDEVLTTRIKAISSAPFWPISSAPHPLLLARYS